MYDDYIDEEEEYGGASKPKKFTIKCLNFNMRISQK